MNTTEMKEQIRTFAAFLIVGLILGNLVSRGLYWIVVNWLAEIELTSILLPILQGAVIYSIAGLSIGFALQRGIENFQGKQMLILTAGWGVGGAIERGASPYIVNWINANGVQTMLPFLLTSFVLTLVAATIYAVSISTAIQQSLAHIRRKQRSAIISNWQSGWMIGWVIYTLYYFFVLGRIALFLHNFVIPTMLGFSIIYGLAGGLIGGRAIYAAIYQIEPLSDPETTKDFKKRHTIAAVIIGVVAATIGSFFRLNLAYSGLEWPGIMLPFPFSLLSSLIGGLLAWAVFIITKQIENTFIRILISGLAGGVLATLIFDTYIMS
jgi:hypothetical protein